MHGAEQVRDAHALAGALAAREHQHVLNQQVEMAQPVDALLEQRAALRLVAPRPALRQIQQRAGQRRADLVREARGHLADRRQALIAIHELLQGPGLGDVGEQDDRGPLLRQLARGERHATTVAREPIAARRYGMLEHDAGDALARERRRGPPPRMPSAARLYSWISPASSTTTTPAGSVPSSERSRSAVSLGLVGRVLARAARLLELGRQRGCPLLQQLIRALQLRR